MLIAPFPKNERERLKALRSYEILDTAPELCFDELTELASEICEVPIALVSLIDHDRQWFKSAVGMSVRETHRDLAFCAHAILEDDIFSVHDASVDDRFADNPLVTADPAIRFYAGAPLQTHSGLNLGTLCVIDRVPRVLSDHQSRALRILSHQAVALLEDHVRMAELARREAEIRTQHASLLRLQSQKDELGSLIVHDLKNPLAAMLVNTNFLTESATLSEDERVAVYEIEESVGRMNSMVMNLLDIGRAEEGMLQPRLTRVALHTLLESIGHSASRRAHQQRQSIVVSAPSDLTVQADVDLLRRILENLVDNCLKYSATSAPIRLEAAGSDDFVEIVVRDEGPGIPRADRDRVFHRYTRLEGYGTPQRMSRGLGLSFCQLAVEAHGGKIWVDDNLPRGSAFHVRLRRLPHSLLHEPC
jgi:K+-sensing histidine kinase KdpD